MGVYLLVTTTLLFWISRRSIAGMGRALSVLVAVTCALVCATAALYLWNEWQDRRQAAEDETAIFTLLKVEPGDIVKASTNCRVVQSRIENAVNLGWTEDQISSAEQLVGLCRMNGFLK